MTEVEKVYLGIVPGDAKAAFWELCRLAAAKAKSRYRSVQHWADSHPPKVQDFTAPGYPEDQIVHRIVLTR